MKKRRKEERRKRRNEETRKQKIETPNRKATHFHMFDVLVLMIYSYYGAKYSLLWTQSSRCPFGIKKTLSFNSSWSLSVKRVGTSWAVIHSRIDFVRVSSILGYCLVISFSAFYSCMESFSWYPTLQDLNPKCWSWLLRWCFQWITPKIPPSHPPARRWRIRPHLLKHWRLGGPKRLSRGILHRRLFHPFPLSVAPRSSRDFKATILRRTAIIRGLQRPTMPFFKSWHLSQLEAVISFFEETWWYLHFYISGTSWSNGLQDDFCTLLTSLPSLYSIRNQDPKTIRPWRKLRCLTKKNLQKYVPLKSCSKRPAAKRTRREPGHVFLLGTDLKQSGHRRRGKQLLKLQRHSAQFGFKSEGADVK